MCDLNAVGGFKLSTGGGRLTLGSVLPQATINTPNVLVLRDYCAKLSRLVYPGFVITVVLLLGQLLRKATRLPHSESGPRKRKTKG